MDIGLPEHISLQDHGNYLEITRRWFSWQIIFTTVFAVFWDAFLVMWYATAFSQKGAPLMALLFPLLHVAVGVGISYFALAGWVNRTRILVSREDLAIRHGPLPWLGGQELKSASLRQLYSKEVVSYSKNGRSVQYQLHAITQEGRNLKLLSGLHSSEQALYIEQQIEKYLGIRDEAVKGEIGYQAPGSEAFEPPVPFRRRDNLFGQPSQTPPD